MAIFMFLQPIHPHFILKKLSFSEHLLGKEKKERKSSHKKKQLWGEQKENISLEVLMIQASVNN